FMQPKADISAYIANSHTLFNTINALIFLPMTKFYVKFLNKIIKPKTDVHSEKIFLDKLLLNTPVAAFQGARTELIRGAKITRSMVADVLHLTCTDDNQRISAIRDNEEIINKMQKDLTRYIVDISREEMTESQSIMVPAMITSINNIERIGDRVVNIIELCEKKIEKDLLFTDNAIKELKELGEMVIKMFDETIIALEKRDVESVER